MPHISGSIAARLYAVGAAVASALVVMAGLGWHEGAVVRDAARSAAVLRQDVETLAEMRLAAARLVLAAMDSIIDREAGDISEERRAIVEASGARLRDGLAAVRRVAREAGSDASVATIEAGAEALPVVIARDLRDLVRSGAPKEAFDAMDDKIDDAGAAMMDAMDALAEAGGARLDERIHAAEAAADETAFRLALIAVAWLAILAPLLVFVIRSVARPVEVLERTTTALTSGHLEVEIGGTDRRDEIGGLARALLVFRDAARDNRRLAEAREHDAAERDRRRAEVQRLVDAFRAGIADVLGAVGRESDRFATTANALGAVAATASREIDAVSVASRSACDNVQGVAGAAEQLAASVAEIGERVESTGAVVGRAAAEAGSAQTEMEVLARSASQIGEFVTLIDSIAHQTNLLALNATIEAARAGEAGRGFAVVAAEVKQLAGQTAAATQDIGRRVAEIQAVTGRAVAAIGQIARSMGEVRDNTAAIAGGVGQQGAATRAIAASVQGAAAGTGEVARSIAEVSASARAADRSAEDVRVGTRQLAGEIERLRHTVEDFVRSVAVA